VQHLIDLYSMFILNLNLLLGWLRRVVGFVANMNVKPGSIGNP
jgi:hypothetical protein